MDFVHQEKEATKIKTEDTVYVIDSVDDIRFINELLGTTFGNIEFVEEARAATDTQEVVTIFSKQYSVDNFRLIMRTPSKITGKYHLNFINDQVSVTVKTVKR